MHELAFTESILDIARRHAEEAGAVRVKRLHILLGALSSFVDDSVRFYWDFIAKGTICEGAELHFERVPARLSCLDCGREYLLTQEMTPCPGCGSFRVQISGGDESRIESMDVETNDSQEADEP